MDYGTRRDYDRRDFDPAEYIVPPNFGKSIGENFHLRIQTGHMRALHIIAKSGMFPCETPQDVGRWCIKHGLDELARRGAKGINSVMFRTNLMLAHSAEDLSKQRMDEVFAKLRESVNGHLARGDWRAAQEMVRTHRKEIQKMPDEPESELRWKMRYMDELDQYKQLEQRGE